MTVPIFIDGRRLLVPPGGTAGAAATESDPTLAVAFANGTAYLTDGRGIATALDTPLGAGMILRVVRSARKRTDADP